MKSAKSPPPFFSFSRFPRSLSLSPPSSSSLSPRIPKSNPSFSDQIRRLPSPLPFRRHPLRRRSTLPPSQSVNLSPSSLISRIPLFHQNDTTEDPPPAAHCNTPPVPMLRRHSGDNCLTTAGFHHRETPISPSSLPLRRRAGGIAVATTPASDPFSQIDTSPLQFSVAVGVLYSNSASVSHRFDSPAQSIAVGRSNSPPPLYRHCQNPSRSVSQSQPLSLADGGESP